MFERLRELCVKNGIAITDLCKQITGSSGNLPTWKKGNIKADKEKSTEKIDGAIATIMGLDRAIRCGNDTSESVYDSRGLLVF